MKLSYPAPTLESLTNALLVVDTCTLINALKTPELVEFLLKVQDQNCALVAPTVVKHELLRGCQNISEQDRIRDFTEMLNIDFIDGAEYQIDTNIGQEFLIKFRRCFSNKMPSYADMLILFTTYLFRQLDDKIFIISSNYRDIPSKLFQPESLISYFDGNLIRNEVIFSVKK